MLDTVYILILLRMSTESHCLLCLLDHIYLTVPGILCDQHNSVYMYVAMQFITVIMIKTKELWKILLINSTLK